MAQKICASPPHILFFSVQNKKLCNQAECDCNYIRLCCNFIHFEWNANSLWWNYRNFSPAILPKKWFAVAVIICRLLNVPNEFEFICTFNPFNADKFNGQFKCANTQRKIESESENRMRNKLVQRRKKLRANSNILSGKSDRDKNRDVEYYLIYFFLGWLKFDLMPECVCDLLWSMTEEKYRGEQ